MVKLSKEAKQRLQQLFKGGQFAIRWGFIPLVIYLGQIQERCRPWNARTDCFELTLGIKVTWIWKQSMDRNNMEGVRSGWDKRWDTVQTFTG
ncbi:mitochondrial import receptor subunit TOM7 homolog isoform X1 [Canis lupus dingo]|uniref:mitochondrial import receptor subunit TOM7 homolog isoform X1 n=1 Tax=Canis lupus dingo TaxID=286419 RepID=UPI0020C38385|nr:mitochondrial import receptor subunit TOM7 homolog isoform X1 [Canis lupus dingo]